MLTGAAGHVMMKHVMNASAMAPMNFRTIVSLARGGSAVHLMIALILIGAGFLLWLASLSRLDLSYAYPLACASALLVALFGVFFLGEPMTIRSLFAVLLIVCGTALLVPTR
jgi:drug/metabolite transporter (DMT)-like permease